jgi:hypothetical protein
LDQVRNSAILAENFDIMTIVTKPLTDEKKDLKPLVLVGNDVAAYQPNAPTDGQDATSTTSEVTVYQHPYRKHRTGVLVCLALLLLLTLACAICGGVYLYFRFSRPDAYRDRCTIRFNNQNQPNAGDRQLLQAPRFPTDPDSDSPRQSFQPARNRMLFPDADETPLDFARLFNSFQQDFELDLRRQLFEILEIPRVPQLGLGRPARFIHDFSLNLTGILDMESRECYVMPLNRTVVKPPQDLYQFLKGLSDGTYTVDGDAISRTYFVDSAPITNTTSLGRYIAQECEGMPTYWLISREDASPERVRREAKNVATFGEFAGNFHFLQIVKNNA